MLNTDLIGVATLVPQTNLPETPSYTEGETLKAKNEGFQEDHMGWLQKEGLLFLPGNLQWKLVNSLHTTTHLGEKAFQRLLENSFRGTGLQTTIRQVVSSCPTCRLSNPQEARRPQLAQPIQQRGTCPGEDGQMDFTRRPISQECAAAAAKSLQSCPTLCGPTDGSPPGSPVPGILQGRTLEWVAISFSNA